MLSVIDAGWHKRKVKCRWHLFTLQQRPNDKKFKHENWWGWLGLKPDCCAIAKQVTMASHWRGGRWHRTCNCIPAVYCWEQQVEGENRSKHPPSSPLSGILHEQLKISPTVVFMRGEEKHLDCIIIGAGISGLDVAYHIKVCLNQGGDRLGSTLVGRIFLVWFGLAKKVWLFGCNLFDI